MQTRPRAAEREKANKHANPHNNLRQEPMRLLRVVSQEFTYIWQKKWVGIIAKKIERTQVHFVFLLKCDVFTATAVMVS